MSVFFGATGGSTKSTTTKKQSAIKVLKQVLQAGYTTLSFTDSSITEDAVIDVYTSNYGVSPTGGSQTGTTLTLTFDPLDTDLNVKIAILEPDGSVTIDNGLSTAVLNGTLKANETSISFTDNSINDNAIINVYTSDYTIKPTAAMVSNNTITLTFDPLGKDLDIKLLIFDGNSQSGAIGGVGTGGEIDESTLDTVAADSDVEEIMSVGGVSSSGGSSFDESTLDTVATDAEVEEALS